MCFHCHYFFMSAALLNPLQSRFFIPCPFLTALTKVTDHVYIVKSDIFQSVSCLTCRQQLILLISPSFKQLFTLSSWEHIVLIRGQICKQQNPFWQFKQKRNILKDVGWLTIYVGGELWIMLSQDNSYLIWVQIPLPLLLAISTTTHTNTDTGTGLWKLTSPECYIPSPPCLLEDLTTCLVRSCLLNQNACPWFSVIGCRSAF